mmetsp:Transcript_7542/g.17306  ORF Transcript_7542/g.17306 Transcript_7542/m.17306 type:complete len:316 (-) Transcript_7542:934-1881(-)
MPPIMAKGSSMPSPASSSSSSSTGAGAAAAFSSLGASSATGLLSRVGQLSTSFLAGGAAFSMGDLPHEPTGLTGCGDTASPPPSVGKSSTEPLYASAFGFGGGFAGVAFATGSSFFSFEPSRSLIICSAFATSASVPLISTVALWSWIMTCTPHVSRMLRNVVPLVPITRRICVWSDSFTSLTISFSTLLAKRVISLFAACTSLAEPMTTTSLDCLWIIIVASIFASSSFFREMIMSACMASCEMLMVATVPSRLITSSICSFAFAFCASSPRITRAISSLLYHTSAPELRAISARFSLLNTRCCSYTMGNFCGV